MKFKEFLMDNISDFESFKKKRDREALEKKELEKKVRSDSDFLKAMKLMDGTPNRYSELRDYMAFYIERYKEVSYTKSSYHLFDALYDMIMKVDKSARYAADIKSGRHEFSTQTKGVLVLLINNKDFLSKLKADLASITELISKNESDEIYSIRSVAERYIWSLSHLIELIESDKIKEIESKIT